MPSITIFTEQFTVADMSLSSKVLRSLSSQVQVGLAMKARSLSDSAAAAYNYNNLNVTVPSPFVYNVEMNRPKKMNALNNEMWTEIGDVFRKLSTDTDCRVVVLSGAGKMFSSGGIIVLT